MTELDPFGAFVERMAVADVGARDSLTFVVKDSIEVAGRAFTAGHPLFAARKGVVTAPVVRQLRGAGAALVGMTRTDAGGFGVTGAGVRNPLCPDLIVGGSTSGGAAAVAAGLADLALGTDTAGSLRIPAACVGAIGFKASHRAVDMAGIWPLAPAFDAVGFIARAWEPLRAAVAALLPARPTRTPVPGDPFTFAVEDAADCRYDAATRHAFEALLGDVVAAGHRLVTVALPDRGAAVQAFSAIVRADAKAFYGRLPPLDPADLGAAARSALALAGQEGGEIGHAREVVATFAAAIIQALRGVDALIAPTLPIAVPRVGTRRVALGGREVSVLLALITETCLANMSGGPAISIPRQREGGTPPFSFCLTGLPASDIRLLDVGVALAGTLSQMEAVVVDA